MLPLVGLFASPLPHRSSLTEISGSRRLASSVSARSPARSGLGVGDRIFAHPLAERVLQLDQLDEEVMLGDELWVRGHRRLEVEAEPLLHPLLPSSCCEVEEQGEVEDQGGG